MSGNEESTAHQQPRRCLLVSQSTVQATSFSEAWRFSTTSGAVMPASWKPSLAIDVGKDAIWVIDWNTNALIASAWLAQMTATPAKRVWRGEPAGHETMPVLVVCVPGWQRLTIGCLERSQGLLQQLRAMESGPFRFSWRGKVQREINAAYLVASADWLTLVDIFGLAPQLKDSQARRR